MEFRGLLGIACLLLLAWGISENRRRVPWRTVLVGVAAQFLLAVLLLKLPPFKTAFLFLNQLALALEEATADGTSMVFGFLGGGPLPFDEKFPGAAYILAFRALPMVLVISALSCLLFYWRILPAIVRGFSRMLQKSMGVGGAVGVGTAANIFVGMVEAPLLVRPYLAGMSRGELFALMTCGMSTVAGTVLVLYATILQSVLPDALGQILTASVISAPAALAVAALMVPDREHASAVEVEFDAGDRSAMDAITRGTGEGLSLLLNIVAMLIVLVALVSLVNIGLNLLPPVAREPVTLQRLLGWLLAPLVWLLGIPWSEATVAGSLLGTKTVLNELLAYLDLAALPPGALGDRSRMIMTYALCGFANFGSLGIMIGGLGTMVPDRRAEVVSLGLKSMIAGTLATCMTGAVVGLL